MATKDTTEAGGFTKEQIDIVFDEISESANVASNLCSEILQESDTEFRAQFIKATMALIERIGYLADLHSEEHRQARGDAAKWVLPPRYHSLDHVS